MICTQVIVILEIYYNFNDYLSEWTSLGRSIETHPTSPSHRDKAAIQKLA
jgi:hypothetical protein